MSGERRIAVDTSFVVDLLKGAVQTRRRVGEIAFPVSVVGELRFGALCGRNPEKNLKEVDSFIARGEIIPIDGNTTQVYAQLRLKLQRAGTPLPENDVWIASTCLQHNLELITLDKHFQRVAGLTLAAP